MAIGELTVCVSFCHPTPILPPAPHISPSTVGPVPAGVNAFDFIAPAPQHHLLPSVEPDEILGVTVIIITASYRDKEFVRVGYYVNTDYEDEQLRIEPPSKVLWDQLYRNVLIGKPKVTR